MNQRLSWIILILVAVLGVLAVWYAPRGVPAPDATPVSRPQLPEPPAAADREVGRVVDRVNIYLIAMDDNGRNGKQIGCGDSVVPIERLVVPTTRPLTAAFTVLLSTGDERIPDGRGGFLYNALKNSNLRISRAAVESGVATVELSGTTSLGGVCDEPRFIAQLEETALQFPTVREARILLDGRPIRDAIGGRG